MRRASLAARLCSVARQQHSGVALREADFQCRGICGCLRSNNSGSAPDLDSWQSPGRWHEQQAITQFAATSSAAALIQHHHYASGVQDDSLIQDEAEIRELGSPRVKRIVEEIVNLNLLEVADLVEILRVRLGLGPESFGMQMQAAPSAAQSAAPAAEAAAAPAAEKTEFDVKLEGFDAAAKIKVIKEVRAITGLGLKEAKEMVEKAPVMLKDALKKEEAEAMKTKLEAGT